MSGECALLGNFLKSNSWEQVSGEHFSHCPHVKKKWGWFRTKFFSCRKHHSDFILTKALQTTPRNCKRNHHCQSHSHTRAHTRSSSAPITPPCWILKNVPQQEQVRLHLMPWYIKSFMSRPRNIFRPVFCWFQLISKSQTETNEIKRWILIIDFCFFHFPLNGSEVVKRISPRYTLCIFVAVDEVKKP